jgi:hypothetical protein
MNNKIFTAGSRSRIDRSSLRKIIDHEIHSKPCKMSFFTKFLDYDVCFFFVRLTVSLFKTCNNV